MTELLALLPHEEALRKLPLELSLCRNKRYLIIVEPAFENLVVRAPGTTKNVAGQPKILMWLSDGQP